MRTTDFNLSYNGGVETTSAATDLHLPAPVLDQLEQLDDTIFDAIDGDPDALDRSSELWSDAVATLGREIVEESRRQYLRQARRRWQQLKDKPGHPPHKSFAALEIISLLSS